MKLSHLIDSFVADVCAGKQNETPESYRRKLHRLVEFFGADHDVTTISATDLGRFKQHLLERKSKKRRYKMVTGALSQYTVRGVLVIARFLFRWATTNGHLATDPSTNLPIPKPPLPDPKAIDEAAVDKLLDGRCLSLRPPLRLWAIG